MKDVNDMTDAEFKVYENRLRRMADRQGMQLVKSRRRDPRAIDYGHYMLVRTETNVGVWPQYMPIDTVDTYLTGDD